MEVCEDCGFETPEDEMTECPYCNKRICKICKSNNRGRCWTCDETIVSQLGGI